MIGRLFFVIVLTIVLTITVNYEKYKAYKKGYEDGYKDCKIELLQTELLQRDAKNE